MKHIPTLACSALFSVLVSPLAAQTGAPGTTTAPAAPAQEQSSTAQTCKSQAGDKKLTGAALNSFMKKCQTDAAKACDSQAGERKLAGAAKTSFTKKCVSDSVGT